MNFDGISNLESRLTVLIKPMFLGGQLLTGFAAVFWFVTCYFLTFVQLMRAKKFDIPQVLLRVVAALLACHLMHELLKTSPVIARFFRGLQAAKRPNGLKNAKQN